MKVLSGVDDIQEALKKWRLWLAAGSIVLAAGGILDRTQGFPILRWVAKPLLSQGHDNSPMLRRIERKQDSVLREQAKIKATVDTLTDRVSVMGDTLASVQRGQKKTQAVVERIAVLTKTQKRIIDENIRKEIERTRPKGLFGDIWGAD